MTYQLKKANLAFVAIFFATLSPISSWCQQAGDTLAGTVLLEDAVNFALKNQPLVRQSLIDEQITASNIRSRLADWYPQVNFNYNLQHNFILQTSVIGGNPIKLGVNNISAGQFSVSQAVFNRDVLLAKRTKEDVLLQARQTTAGNKIEIAAAVSKAFYDVLATTQQIRIAEENITRIERSLKDATSQYKAGIADKIDYKRATISLNNSRASRRSNEALAEAKKEYLKSLMGYPAQAGLSVSYDSVAMEEAIWIDTLQQPGFNNRIEFKILETQKKLLETNVLYNRWSYLPSVSVNGAYNLNFQNDKFTKLYGTNYPNSFAALTLALPILQGGKRKADLQTANLQLQRNKEDLMNLQNTVNAQYAQALAVYKSSLQYYLALKENVALAKEVYDVIQLQYRAGIKTYLEVLTAETDLRSSQINYYNALYQVLSGKVDVQVALGQINY